MKFLCTLVLQLVMTGCLFSQVTFTQTTNDDFLKGSLNNVLVSNDQVSVPAKATAISDWYATTNLPATLSGHQIVTWRNYAYLTGGFDGTNYSAAVYRTTVNTGGIGSWTTLTALPLSLKNHAVVTGHNMIYVLGGKNANTISDKIYYASLDPASGNIGTWQLSTVTLPYPLWGHKAQYINGYLYVTGGSDQAGNTTAKNEVLVCQIDAEGGLSAITATTSLPESRNGHTMVTYDNQIFILGGFANGGTKQKTVYYAGINNDGSIGNWLSASPLPTPVSNHVSTCSNGIITVIGGADTTEIGITDKFYFADIAAWPVLAWTDSYKNLIDRTKDAQAYVSDGQILYAGGTNLSSANVSANRYVPLQLGAQKMNRTSFVSARFFIGAIKTIQQLEYSLSYSTGDSYEILYRVAGPNKIWGSWNSRGQNNPAILNEEMSYLQYMIRFTANSTQSISLNDLTMRISGYTQLSGNLNSMNTLSLSASPYWATGDIQFTSGSHTIEAGVKIVFSPNTGLDIGAASVSFNGTALNPVTLSYYDSLQGQWRGVLFNSASNPNASQMNYTIIEKAGQGTNNANLYCQSTAQPTISNCIFRHCDGHGLRLESANLNISSTSILNNTESGLFLQSANPVLNTVNISYNGYAGIYYNTAGITPSFTNCLVHHNIYGIYSPTPDNSFAPATPTSVVLNNNSNAIAIGTNVGSNITAARNWKYFPDGYAILGSISVIQTSTVPRLTIAPGTKVKVAKNANIIIGQTNGSGGELSAVGKPDSLITFTALNDSTGGWMGLDFRNGADNGSISSLQYCIVEKGKDYNIQVTDAQMPAIKYSIIRNTQGSGIRLLSNSGITIEETTIKNNLLNGIYCDNSNPVIAYCIIDSCLNAGICLNGTTLVPTIFSTTIKNTNYGTYVPYLTGITSNLLTALRNINFLNVYASVASLGATFTSDFKLYAFKYPYYLLDHIYVYKGNDKARLTLAPGVTLKFAQGKLLQIGANNNNGGELFAIGKVDSLITFSSINGQKGGWDGIYFNQWADNYSNSNSILRNCVIENGNQRNIWIEHDSHTKIDSCKIRFAKQFGLLTTGDQTNDSITNCFFDNNDSIGANCQTLTSFYNCRFSNNGDYGLYFSDSHWCRYLNKLSWANNGSHNLVINGGSIQVNTLWHAVNTDYCILGTITVYKYNDKVRLTIAPGVSIKFASGKKLQIGTVSGYYSDQYYGGELFAIGKADSLINFSSLNGIKGGWEGIYISQWADNYNNAASVLRNCIIEKGNDKCLWIEHDSHTSIDSCVIKKKKKYGLYTSGDQSNCTISNSLITENDSIGANCQGAITNFYKCSFTNNGDYGLYFSDSYYCKSLSNLSWGNNGLYNLVINGGSIQVNTTWNAVGTDYCILGTITVYKYNDKVRLTIEPGVSLKFALGKKLQIGTVGGYYGDQYYGGELYAIGKADSLIKFSSINGIKGGWDGIYISQFADNYGGINCLKNCILEDGNDRNLWVEHDSHTSIVQ
ncbi:MAG: right-handed parallel beta-helix repeat-containing protein [Bacteroidetes bacterium]|nr:right-handed parallel beta-helix repeat-containing protein [Bacteroidota bacterium]